MLNDLISDGLTRIRNASMRKLETAKLLHSKVVEATLSILAAKGYVESYNVVEENNKKFINVVLKYDDHGRSVINELKRVSKPGRRVYQGKDDIKRFNVDIFTVGSDWEGYFDYLNEYCKVVYLPRTQGISSTQIRNSENVRLGIIGNEVILDRFLDEAKFVSGIDIIGGYTETDAVDTIYKSHQFNDLEQFSSSKMRYTLICLYLNV